MTRLRVVAVLRSVFGNPDLRRVELAFAGFNAAEWAVWIAMLVYAYGRGGAAEAGIVALVQLAPAAAFGPFAAVMADRRRPAAVLAAGYAAQALAMALTAAVLLGDGPSPLAYAFAAAAATAVTVTRPTQSALVPALARAPDELTAANVVSGWIESVSMLVAPALAGVLLAVASPGAVFAVMAVVALASVLLVLPVEGPAALAPDSSPSPRDAIAGFRQVARDRQARTLVGILGAQYVAIGALDVLFVVLAVDALSLGAAWAGYLNAAFGAGGVLGIAVTVTLVGRPRLSPPLLLGVVVWSAAFAALALRLTTATALLLLAAAGAGRSLLDVAGRTLLQRTCSTAVLSRVFGVLEGISMAGLAAGALLVPVLVGVFDARGALLALALLVPAALLPAGRRLLELDSHADVPAVEIGLLRSLPLFAPLGAPELESLARRLVPVDATPGTTVVTEGTVGDRFYVVGDGELAVSTGAVLRRSDCFGEIALLRDVPRTATVTAGTDARLYALSKDDFLEAVTTHPRAADAADRLVRERLAAPLLR
ncbi:MAG TPA: cyclic nucleotide-binding domain-containing protein [Gaiellaceae bacterium]|nr:cyclic nucleotide-binding domain-containing protein [Gaiellaceae bacterium]